MTNIRTLGIMAVASLALASCSTINKVNPFHSKAPASTAPKGVRIPVIALNDQLKVADALKGQDFYIPPAEPLDSWPLPGGTPSQSV